MPRHKKIKLSVLNLVIILLFVLMLAHTSQTRGENFQTETRSLPSNAIGDFIIMSSNIRGTNKLFGYDCSGGFDHDSFDNTSYKLGRRLANLPWDILVIQENFDCNDAFRRGLDSVFGSFQHGSEYDNDPHSIFEQSGLDVFSKQTIEFTPDSVQHITWDRCSDSVLLDCHANKGFMILPITVKSNDGASLYTAHLYNIHMDAGDTYSDITTRYQQLIQLNNYVKTYSWQTPTIFAGDFNLDPATDADWVLLHSFFLTSLASVPACNYSNPDNRAADDESAVGKCFSRVDQIWLKSVAGLYFWNTDADLNTWIYLEDPVLGTRLTDHPAVQLKLHWGTNLPTPIIPSKSNLNKTKHP